MLERTFVVKQAVNPESLAVFARRASEAYALWDSRIEQKSAELSQPLIDRFVQGHIPVSELGDAAVERLANGGYPHDLVRHVFRWTNRLESPRDFLLRRILPPTMKSALAAPTIAYHQDEYFSIASDPNAPPPSLCFTMWVPLVDGGRDAPELTVFRGSDKPVVMGEPPAGWDSYVATKYGPDALWSPELAAGDVLIFTSRTIHGSYVTDEMTLPRYSLEVRGGIN